MVKVEPDGRDKLEELKRLEEDVHFRPTGEQGRDDYGDEAYRKLIDYNRRVGSDISRQRKSQEKAGAGEQSDFSPAASEPPSRFTRVRHGIGQLGNRIFGSPSWAKKWVIAGGLSGIGTVVLIGAALFIMASMLKLPNLLANITEYEFINVVRASGNAARQVIEEELASETMEPALYDKWVDSVKSAGARVGETLDNKMLKQLSPNAAIRVLGTQSDLKINYYTKDELSWGDVLAGRKVIKSIELNGQTFDAPPQTGGSGLLPKLKITELFSKDTYSNLGKQVDFAAEFAPALRTALRENNINPVIRWRATVKFQKMLGINKAGWNLGDFKGKNDSQAQAADDLEIYNQVKQATPNTPLSEIPDVNEAAHEAADATEHALEDPNQAAAMRNNSGIAPAAEKAIEDTIGPSALKDVVSFVNPIYGVAVPACIIYDGSLEKQGPTINNNVRAQQALLYAFASRTQQLQEGLSGKGDWQDQLKAWRALDEKVGDPTESNPYLRANGQTVDTLATSTSVETNAMQEFTLLDATPGLGGTGVADVIKKLANGDPTTGQPGVCSYLTDIRFGIISGVVLTAVTVLLDIPSGGGASAGEVTAEAAMDEATQQVTKSFVTKFVEKFLGEAITKKAVVGKLRELVVKSAFDFANLTTLTFAAKLLVWGASLIVNNGTSAQGEFVNQVDSGANLHAGEICRRQQFCRPVTCSELNQINQANKQFIAEQNESKGFADRYLALSNPDSLLNKTAMMTYSQFNGSLLRPLANALNIFNGPLSFGTVFNSATGISFAATPCSHLYYGNVQFAWTEDEEHRISSNDSYLPLENQKILDQSGMEAEIASKYAACFGYSYSDSGASMDPQADNSKLIPDVDGDGSIGSLLANGDIVRNVDGDVVADQGLCSPQNLSYHNPAYGDLVFRWRLAMRYDSSVNQLIDTQSITTE